MQVSCSNRLAILFQLWETSFKNLGECEILNCHNLKSLFPLHSVESIPQLKKLSVWNCSLIVMVMKEEREEGSFKKISFPKLESLHFIHLPRLKTFCTADGIEFPSLLELVIWDCPELRTFIVNSSFTPTQTTVEEETKKRDMVGQQPMFNEKVISRSQIIFSFFFLLEFSLFIL